MKNKCTSKKQHGKTIAVFKEDKQLCINSLFRDKRVKFWLVGFNIFFSAINTKKIV